MIHQNDNIHKLVNHRRFTNIVIDTDRQASILVQQEAGVMCVCIASMANLLMLAYNQQIKIHEMLKYAQLTLTDDSC